jgi:predicted nucleic acid-binding protein
VRFVLDASVTVTWALRDEDHPLADLAFSELGLGSAIVPAIWWYEIRNVMILNERRGRITTADVSGFLLDLNEFSIRVEPPGDGEATLHLARRFNLSFYDAAYLELAIRERIPLSTLDKALQTAARAAGVSLPE